MAEFFLPCARGVEYLLAQELRELGADDVRETIAGVSCQGPQRLGYTLCLWSRLASRVLLVIDQAVCRTADELYRAVQKTDWARHVAADGSLMVDFSGTNAEIRHTTFGAMKVKDAIVDQCRERFGLRPSVSTEEYDLRINANLKKDRLTLSIDLSGEALHRRGYRTEAGAAPIRETLVAALLRRCDWPGRVKDGANFVDPMCGSGTMLIEAAMMALDRAPGLSRTRWGFSRWLGHEENDWQQVYRDAVARSASASAGVVGLFRGFDADASVLDVARRNIARAGLDGVIEVAHGEVAELGNKGLGNLGLVMVNPPYGVRLGDEQSLELTYRALGAALMANFTGWHVGVITSRGDLAQLFGMRFARKSTFFNGAIECELLEFDVSADARRQEGRPRIPVVASPERAAMLANRLRKNLRGLKKWLAGSGVSCYRVYDADMPEYAVAIDRYDDWVYVQEYAPPASVDARAATERFDEVLAVLPEVLGLAPAHIVTNRRERQRGSRQYRATESSGHELVVSEHGVRLSVNLGRYVDTGLFLDHRPVRRWIAEHARGKRFLNLFCYTGAVTVHAAVGGAASTLSIDMSRTYLEWAHRNLALNGLANSRHRLLQADCVAWLEEAEGSFDMILLDPPTFSNSKRMEGVMDVQRDHAVMIRHAMRLLADGGVLVFSNNYQKFVLDSSLADEFDVRDVTSQTVDPDFVRRPGIHRCWHLQHR